MANFLNLFSILQLKLQLEESYTRAQIADGIKNFRTAFPRFCLYLVNLKLSTSIWAIIPEL